MDPILSATAGLWPLDKSIPKAQETAQRARACLQCKFDTCRKPGVLMAEVRGGSSQVPEAHWLAFLAELMRASDSVRDAVLKEREGAGGE